MPPPHWEPSSEKHGVPRESQIHAILHATFADQLAIEANGDVIMLYIGPEHPQTDREIEVLVRRPRRSGAEASIFHAMPLGPKFRRLREDSRSD
jgi:hypothetical protein